mmetsp:Transcript_33014/g.38437  ORF Transcript_33014/g.38437 Transcript_33014/m.38437 type:complete len:949 (-) Transcript_33014:42-2888(-)
MPHRHRSSGLKQSNKGHKSNKSSKRSLNRSAGGKVQGRVGIKKKGGVNGVASKAKADRAHMAKQRRMASKEKLLQQKRVQGRLNTNSAESEKAAIVPRVVGIISLAEIETQLENDVRKFLVDASDKSNASSGDMSSVTAIYQKYKKEGYVTFLTNTSSFSSYYTKVKDDEDSSVQAALDLCRVCDTVMFLVDGRDAENNGSASIAGMDIGGGASVSTSTTTGQQNYDHLISARGERVLSAIKSQGLPTPLTVLVNFEGGSDDDNMSMSSSLSFKSVRRTAIKRKLGLRKYLSRLALTEFGEGSDKVIELEIPDVESNESMNIDDQNILQIGKSKKILPGALSNKNDMCPSRDACLRTLCTMSASPPKWVSEMPRAYLFSDGSGKDNAGYVYDKENNELRIKGFIRGKAPWNVNNLVHIPNVGTFRVKQIEKSDPSLALVRKRKQQSDIQFNMTDQILAVRDEDLCESLEMFANPDALDGEQNLIGFEDGYDDDHDNKDISSNGKSQEFNKGAARPAGWSDYQSAWLGAIDDDGESQAQPFDHGELAFDLNKKKGDAAAITSMDMDDEDANHVSAHERQILLEQRQKDKQDDMTFPDEVEVKEDENARDRYARYRSLKSFRKSYWDPKENLPDTYGTIYHFNSFKATQGDVMADMNEAIKATNKDLVKDTDVDDEMMDDEMMDDDEQSNEDPLEGCVLSGTYVSLVVEGVAPVDFERVSKTALMTAVCLLPHENKISVLHMSLSQTTQCDEYGNSELPVKSKDLITFRCGWRTWKARPVFSQNNLNSDKHKFERFMPTEGAFFASSVFGPVTYTPCPVLLFRDQSEKSKFVALGSLFNADADRIVVKRIILTGFPTRVHKRHATVKYMFYNPDDVKWFKPAGLTTKHGLQGNIIDSVGDHGTMKCLFNAPIKQHDTVCIPLYKRIYPKYATSDVIDENGEKVKKNIIIL